MKPVFSSMTTPYGFVKPEAVKAWMLEERRTKNKTNPTNKIPILSLRAQRSNLHGIASAPLGPRNDFFRKDAKKMAVTFFIHRQGNLLYNDCQLFAFSSRDRVVIQKKAVRPEPFDSFPFVLSLSKDERELAQDRLVEGRTMENQYVIRSWFDKLTTNG